MDKATIGEPAPGATALVIVDMINDMSFEGAEAMLDQARAAARAILDLRHAADRLKVPVVYVNDNYGQWHSEKSLIVEHCREGLGRDLVDLLAPRDDDYFIIKPQVSGFYATNLPVLLPKLGASRLVLAGLAADICVLFTAADAHMRDYQLWVPADTTASETDEHAAWALETMRKSLAAETRKTTDYSLDRWIQARAPPAGAS